MILDFSVEWWSMHCLKESVWLFYGWILFSHGLICEFRGLDWVVSHISKSHEFLIRSG